MTKQPDQEIHDLVYAEAQKLGYKVHLGLPGKDEPYPFVVLGDTQIVPRPVKCRLIGTVYITVHIWGNAKQRKQVSDAIGLLMNTVSKLQGKSGRVYSLNLASDSQIIKDNSTVEMLYHGICDLEFTFY